MVAHLGLRTHELLSEEIGKYYYRNLLACEKPECYEEVTNHSQCIVSLIKNDDFRFFLH